VINRRAAGTWRTKQLKLDPDYPEPHLQMAAFYSPNDFPRKTSNDDGDDNEQRLDQEKEEKFRPET
jgi:hypothetical protein